MAWLRCSRCSTPSNVPRTATLLDPETPLWGSHRSHEQWMVCPSCHELARARAIWFGAARHAFAGVSAIIGKPFEPVVEPTRSGQPVQADGYPLWMIDTYCAAMWWMR